MLRTYTLLHQEKPGGPASPGVQTSLSRLTSVPNKWASAFNARVAPLQAWTPGPVRLQLAHRARSLHPEPSDAMFPARPMPKAGWSVHSQYPPYAWIWSCLMRVGSPPLVESFGQCADQHHTILQGRIRPKDPTHMGVDA